MCAKPSLGRRPTSRLDFRNSPETVSEEDRAVELHASSNDVQQPAVVAVELDNRSGQAASTNLPPRERPRTPDLRTRQAQQALTSSRPQRIFRGQRDEPAAHAAEACQRSCVGSPRQRDEKQLVGQIEQLDGHDGYRSEIFR
eukprot:TRINITY_DN1144_c0_g1_i4.p2 TRINITY_DN1144_c0_g1~~TRINITY_DN1144_c0_g1_i4.p2  ORF type:complete len:142 (-),score=12.22 TRINITY_DN1144_c0_g1_i4:311-736(-)